jgi:hypothetical protein
MSEVIELEQGSKKVSAKNLLVILLGVLLSFLLLSIGVFVTMRTTTEGRMSRELAPRASTTTSEQLAHEAEKYGDPFKLMTQTLRIYEFAVLPCVAILVGLFVGAIAKGNVPGVSAVALLPLVIFYMISASWNLRSVADSIGYLSLGIAASILVARRRSRLQAAHSTAL